MGGTPGGFALPDDLVSALGDYNNCRSGHGVMRAKLLGWTPNGYSRCAGVFSARLNSRNYLPPFMNKGALSVSELRYRRLFESAHDGILLLDPVTRRIIEANPFMENILGYDRAELLGKELFEIGLPQNQTASQAAFQELLANGQIRYENLPLQTKSGQRVEVEFVSNLYPEGTQQIIQCNVRDITVRKQLENSLRDADLKLSRHAAELENLVNVRTAELRQSNQQLERFIYSIAHDLRAPLRSMQGFAQLLVLEHAERLSQPGRDCTKRIMKAAQMMDQLLVDLLEFSLVSKQEMQLAPVALETVVQSALTGCENEIIESEAQIESHSPWPAVVAHATTLRQVLVNLIGNAVKFVAGKPPQVQLRSEERPNGIVRIWVEDNGIGIPMEFHERIFQVFQRLHTTSYAGTGIGLAIVQKGMDRMSGRVGLDSTPGEGSRFWIELPKAPSETERGSPELRVERPEPDHTVNPHKITHTSSEDRALSSRLSTLDSRLHSSV